MRRILLALFLALAPAAVWAAQPADADACVCSGGLTCANDSATNWSGCGGAAPDSNDTVLATGTGTVLNLHATAEVKNLVAQAGAAVICNNPAAMTLTFNTFTSPPIQFVEEFFVIDGYNSPANPPSFTCSGKDVIIKWKGTSASGAVMFLGSVSNQINAGAASNVNATLRGIERAKTSVGAFSEGLTTGTADFKDCIKYPSGFSPASTPVVGDTIVFTTGKSTDYWYKVTGVGTTTECRATDCAGSTCDLEITRNDATASPGMVTGSRSWSSMTKTAALGGPVRAATPDDADANGTADSANTRPAAGDAFVVFLPIRIQGGEKPIAGNGATDTGGGIVIYIGGVNLDTRYVEAAKMSGQNTESCVPGVNGSATIWTMIDNIVSPETTWGFWNVHDWASGQGAMEIGPSKLGSDTRPNYPFRFEHWYLHDSDTEISSTPCTRTGMGSGIEVTLDSANDNLDGLTWTGLHMARLHTGSGFAVNPTTTGVNHKNILLRGLIAHDIPQVLAYALTPSGDVLSVGAGQTTVEGYAAWDLGGAANAYRPFGWYAQDNLGNPTSVSIYNAFVVNVDTNTDGFISTGSSGFDFDRSGAISTDKGTISNSYITNIVGSAGKGGNWNFNFIKNPILDDAGGACVSSRRSVLHSPVSVIGNVITRSSAISCMQYAISYEGFLSGSDYSNQTRRVVSNVFANVDWTRTDDGCAALHTRNEGSNVTRNIDFYNNVVDFNGNTCGAGNSIGIWTEGGGFTGTITAFYNIFGSGSAAGDGTRGTLVPFGNINEDYNRCFLLDGACISSGNNTHDIDSDTLDIFDDRPNFRMSQRCDSPDRTRNPWGGPVGPIAFGIKNFGWFHPAVVPLMDADAFKRYDWRECGRSYKDLLPR